MEYTITKFQTILEEQRQFLDQSWGYHWNSQFIGMFSKTIESLDQAICKSKDKRELKLLQEFRIIAADQKNTLIT